MISRKLETLLNALGLFGIAAVLLFAFYDQVANNELPCPLCLLQRAGFLLLAIGPVLNVMRGPKPAHYGIATLAGLLGAGFAARQVLLHIAPGDAGYGAPFMGIHFYTWALVVFLGAIAACALMLMIRDAQTASEKPQVTSLGKAAVLSVILLAGLNAASTLLESGFDACPDNPVAYELLKP